MLVVASTEGAICNADMNPLEWAAVIKELQNALDDFNTFVNRN